MSVLQSSSTTGSLSSIITTSVASSEPDPGLDQASGIHGGGNDDDGDDKCVPGSRGVLKLEKWWETTLQVSIPFFVAGIGTIGAGIILGHVEVSVLFFVIMCEF